MNLRLMLKLAHRIKTPTGGDSPTAEEIRELITALAEARELLQPMRWTDGWGYEQARKAWVTKYGEDKED